jgi:hypothetical protein
LSKWLEDSFAGVIRNAYAGIRHRESQFSLVTFDSPEGAGHADGSFRGELHRIAE